MLPVSEVMSIVTIISAWRQHCTVLASVQVLVAKDRPSSPGTARITIIIHCLSVLIAALCSLIETQLKV